MSEPVCAIVAEDEAPQRDALCASLAALWPALRILPCEDGIAALEAAVEHRPRIAFLDIRMPGSNGLEVAQMLKQQAHIVFTTAYDEFAIKAFEAGAVDYLLKPIRPQRLAEAVARLKLRLELTPPALDGLLASLRQQLAPVERPAALRWITAALGDTTRLIPVDEVLYFQAHEKYVRVVTATLDALIRTPLRELLAGLDQDRFWQVHRSVVVRADAIDRMRKDDRGKYHLWLRGRDECLPLSSAFLHRFKAM